MINHVETWGGGKGGCCRECVQPASAKHLTGRVGTGALAGHYEGAASASPGGCGCRCWRLHGDGRWSLLEAIKPSYLNFQVTVFYTQGWASPLLTDPTSPQVSQHENSFVKIYVHFKPGLLRRLALSRNVGVYVCRCSATPQGLLNLRIFVER